MSMCPYIKVQTLPFETEHIEIVQTTNAQNPELNIRIQIGNRQEHTLYSQWFGRVRWFSVSTPNETENIINAILSEEYYICSMCGRWEEKNRTKSAVCGKTLQYQAMENMHLCFHCSFWCEKVLRSQREKHWYRNLVIDGSTFHCHEPGLQTGDNSSMGFGGRIFIIRNLSTNEEITTNCLWHGDFIPSVFRDFFPNNAEITAETDKGFLKAFNEYNRETQS